VKSRTLFIFLDFLEKNKNFKNAIDFLKNQGILLLAKRKHFKQFNNKKILGGTNYVKSR
jgi:hypothetical protein